MAGHETSDALLRDIPLVALRVDAGLRLRAWNELMEQLFAAPHAEVLGLPITEVIPTAAGEEGWRALLASPKGTRRVWDTRARDGRPLRLAFIVQPDAAGGARIFGRDLTAEHTAETARLALIERQEEALRRLDAPILEISDRIFAVPLIGAFDEARLDAITTRLLGAVTAARARVVVLDLTGVDALGPGTEALLRLTRALRLLGAEAVLSGLRPGLAAELVACGVDLGHTSICATLREALRRFAR